MKHLIKPFTFVLFILFISCPAYSGDVKLGVGATATSSSSTIFFPLKTSSFIVEPMVGLQRKKSESTSTLYSQYNESSAVTIGSGFFLYSEIFNNVDLIYGAQIGYIKDNRKTREVEGFREQTWNYDLSGFIVAPTAGIEYNFNSHISVGCYISLEYVRLTGDETYRTTASSEEMKYDTEVTDYSTKTDLYVKYYF